MPVVFSMSTRTGLTCVDAFTTGASVVATLPWRSVRASSRALRDFLPSRVWIASERNMSCGKSIRHSCC